MGGTGRDRRALYKLEDEDPSYEVRLCLAKDLPQTGGKRPKGLR